MADLDSGVRLAEFMAALSMATDLGMGKPLDSAQRSSVVVMGLGEAMHLDDADFTDIKSPYLLDRRPAWRR